MIWFLSVNSWNVFKFGGDECDVIAGDGEGVKVEPEIPGNDVKVDNSQRILAIVPDG